ASVSNIILLLSFEFTQLIVIANIIAYPAAYWIIRLWQNNFAYRAGIDILVFIIGSILTFLIAFSTISYQTIKVALTNPVRSLRYW
ncbi:hypothetical protein LLG96_20000, partial [bacterium]|nr:hypothetical protein [bacterium]